MKVAFLGHSAALSGAELFLAGMLTRQSRLEPLVVLFEDGPLVARLGDAGIPVVVVTLPRGLLDLPASGSESASGPTTGDARVAWMAALPLFAVRLAALLRRERVDLCYSNSAKAHVIGLPVARSLGLPSVMHVHNAIDPAMYGRANRAALRAAAATATTLIANSEFTRGTLPQPADSRITTMYCPTEVPEQPAPSPNRRDPQLAMVGRVTHWKGQDLAIRALARLRASGSLHTLHIYGDALFERDRAYLNERRGLARHLGVDAAVSWHGHVHDVPAALVGHDVAIHASRMAEPMGQVILEAMAAARPVVAADSGGPRELVRRGVTGLLYATGEYEDLARSLLDLSSPRTRTEMGREGWRRAAEFSYERIIPLWEDLLMRTGTTTRRSRPHA